MTKLLIRVAFVYDYLQFYFYVYYIRVYIFFLVFVIFYFIYLFLLTVLRVSLVQPKHRWVSDRINCPRDGECVILANVEGCCYPCSLRHCHLIALFVVEEKDGNKIPEKEMKWLMGWMNEWKDGWVVEQSISVYLRSVACKNIWIFVLFFWGYIKMYIYFLFIFL